LKCALTLGVNSHSQNDGHLKCFFHTFAHILPPAVPLGTTDDTKLCRLCMQRKEASEGLGFRPAREKR
jgi:hypothetical protein